MTEGQIPCDAGDGTACVYVEIQRSKAKRNPQPPATFWLCQTHADNACRNKNATCVESGECHTPCGAQPEDEEDKEWLLPQPKTRQSRSRRSPDEPV